MNLNRNILIAAALASLVGCYTSSDDDDNTDANLLDVTSDAAETDTDETDASDTDTPDTDTPDTVTPDTDTPDTVTPDTDTPDTVTPDTDTPDVEPTDIGQDATDEMLCADACAYFIECTNTVCFEPIAEFDACIDECLPDPINFQADLILSLSCDEIIDAVCDPNMCDCPSTTVTDCADGYQCIVDCGGDEACQQACFGDLSPEGQEVLSTMFGCFDTQCAGVPDEEAQACVQDQCGVEIDDCFGGGGTDNLFCLRQCDTDMDCNVDEFCFALDDTVSGCVTGTSEAPALPTDSPECDADQSCAPGQFCVSAG